MFIVQIFRFWSKLDENPQTIHRSKRFLITITNTHATSSINYYTVRIERKKETLRNSNRGYLNHFLTIINSTSWYIIYNRCSTITTVQFDKWWHSRFSPSWWQWRKPCNWASTSENRSWKLIQEMRGMILVARRHTDCQEISDCYGRSRSLPQLDSATVLLRSSSTAIQQYLQIVNQQQNSFQIEEILVNDPKVLWEKNEKNERDERICFFLLDLWECHCRKCD